MTAYNPSDPTQSNFLSILASGESGGYSDPTNIGYGGVDLSGASTNQYGFPLWAGSSTSAGPTHAAGIFQFEPSTWNGIASQLGINSFSSSNQNAAAWTLADQAYSSATGGSLESALQSGDTSSVASALKNIWPSITKSLTGNGTASATGTNSGGVASYLGLDWVTQIQAWLAESKFWQRLLFGVLALILIGAAFMLLARGQAQNIVKSAM